MSMQNVACHWKSPKLNRRVVVKPLHGPVCLNITKPLSGFHSNWVFNSLGNESLRNDFSYINWRHWARFVCLSFGAWWRNSLVTTNLLQSHTLTVKAVHITQVWESLWPMSRSPVDEETFCLLPATWNSTVEQKGVEIDLRHTEWKREKGKESTRSLAAFTHCRSLSVRHMAFACSQKDFLPSNDNSLGNKKPTEPENSWIQFGHDVSTQGSRVPGK